MGVDVSQLIGQWSNVVKTMYPSQNLFGPASEDRQLAEISLLCSRQQYWEVFVCLIGYSEMTGQNPNEVVNKIPYGQIWREDLTSAWQTDAFLRYCAGFMSVKSDEFLAGAYTIALTIAHGTITMTPELLERFQKCFALHDSRREFWDCMRAK